MTTKRLVFTKPDGSISIIYPSLKARREDESEDDFLARVWARNVEVGKQATRDGGSHEEGTYPTDSDIPAVIEQEVIPTDYAFRDAWRLNGAAVDCDMTAAKEIQRDRLRRERAPLLAALDIEVTRALVSGDQAKVAEVEAERQRLRDVTALPAIDAAQTPDDLKAIRAQDRR